MKKKESKNNSNDVLRSKITQLNESIFVKKSNLQISDFIPPLLWTGIPFTIVIITAYIINKYRLIPLYLNIAYCLLILSFAVLMGCVFWGFIETLVTFKKSYKPFTKYIVDDFIAQVDIQKNVNKLIKDIDHDSLQKYIDYLSSKTVQKEKRNPYIYGGLKVTSLFSLIVLFIKTSKNLFSLIMNNEPFNVSEFFIFIIPLLFAISFYLDYKEIEKCKIILSYLSKTKNNE